MQHMHTNRATMTARIKTTPMATGRTITSKLMPVSWGSSQTTAMGVFWGMAGGDRGGGAGVWGSLLLLVSVLVSVLMGLGWGTRSRAAERGILMHVNLHVFRVVVQLPHLFANTGKSNLH